MTKQEIQRIIDQLVSDNPQEEAFFGIFQYGGGSDESYIRANRQGLGLFSAELLKASRDAEELIDSERKAHIIELEEDVLLDVILLFSTLNPPSRKEARLDKKT